MSNLLEPKDITIQTQSGAEKTFVLSKFPALAGREIVAKYPLSAMPKIGDYEVNEQTMLKLMNHVGVKTDNGNVIRLSTTELYNNHVPDWETSAKIEWAMMEYNCSFFANGRSSSFFEAIAQKVPVLITKILTDLSAQSSRKEKQPSTNSEQSTL